MRLIRSVVLALALLIAPLAIKAQIAGPAPEQPSIAETLSKASLALYQGRQVCGFEKVDTFIGSVDLWSCKFVNRFVCTATVIDRISQTDYIGLTAGHCFDWKHDNQYYVADTVEEKPVLHKIMVLKHEADDRYDFAIFTFTSAHEYPAISIDTTVKVPALGTEVININFAMGVGKAHLTGKVVSEALDESHLGMRQRYLVTVGVGPGASGSAIVDLQTGKIIGLVEAGFPGTQMATIVIPTGERFMNFIDDDSAGIRPLPPPRGPQPPQQAPDEDEKSASIVTRIVRAILSFFQHMLGK